MNQTSAFAVGGFLCAGAAAIFFWSEAAWHKAQQAELAERIQRLEQSVQSLRNDSRVRVEDALPNQRSHRGAERLQLAAGDRSDTPNDPLAFYRRNPELMKRYFPHLYKAEMEGNPPSTQRKPADEAPVEAPPADPIEKGEPVPAVDSGAETPAPAGNQSNDRAMEFYRRNPELMKRYFPHLQQNRNVVQPAIAPAK